MKFLIKANCDEAKELYKNHSTYHQGDSGLDLFIVKDEVIYAGETRLVDLGISCQLKGSKYVTRYHANDVDEIKVVDVIKPTLTQKDTPIVESDSGEDVSSSDEEEVEENIINPIFKPIKVDKYFSYNMYSRSSISKTPLRLANGVGLCDAGYLGPLKAALHNTGTTDYTVKKGERYVQLARPDLEEVSFELVEELRSTDRGTGGFGSTGK